MFVSERMYQGFCSIQLCGGIRKRFERYVYYIEFIIYKQPVLPVPVRYAHVICRHLMYHVEDYDPKNYTYYTITMLCQYVTN